MKNALPPIILASSSVYRKKLLQQLALPFVTEAPNIDESVRDCESPRHLCLRLSEEKSLKVAQKYPHACVIGSDQTAHCLGQYLLKPTNFDESLAQLLHIQGQEIDFFTGLCVRRLSHNICLTTSVSVKTKVRALDRETIINYISKEQPFGCLGSIRTEGLGIALMEKIETEDPSAVIGLPLIALVGFLAQCGITVFPTHRFVK